MQTSISDQNGYTGCVGVIVGIDEPEGMYKVIWYDGGKEWLTDYENFGCCCKFLKLFNI